VKIEDAAQRRHLVAGDIGVPALAADALGIGIGVDRQYLGMPLRPREGGVNVQFSEISAHPLVSFLIHPLVAEEQDLVLRQGLMQLST
jgi:hypothetical protein